MTKREEPAADGEPPYTALDISPAEVARMVAHWAEHEHGLADRMVQFRFVRGDAGMGIEARAYHKAHLPPEES